MKVQAVEENAKDDAKSDEGGQYFFFSLKEMDAFFLCSLLFLFFFSLGAGIIFWSSGSHVISTTLFLFFVEIPLSCPVETLIFF